MEGVQENPGIEAEQPSQPQRRRRRWWWLVVVALLVASLLLAGWLLRRDLVDRAISGQLSDLGLPATYQVVEVGPERQVLRNLVIGDPQRPDLVVDQVVVETTPHFGVPTLDRVTLVKPRLWGTLKGGKPSFGSLDKVLFTGSKEPFRLPDLNLVLQDARVRIDSDFGPLGIKADGAGNLRDGFGATLAAVAPQLAQAGCRGEGASLYGRLTITAERPTFAGPARLAQLACANGGPNLAAASAQLDLDFAKTLDSAQGTVQLVTGALAYGGAAAKRLDGNLDLAWRGGDLSLGYDLAATTLRTGSLGAGRMAAKGSFTARDRFARIEADGTVTGTGLRFGPELDGALAQAQRAAAGSFAAGMLGQVRAGLAREMQGGRLVAVFVLRRSGRGTQLLVPNARLDGARGARLLAVSRLQYTTGPRQATRIAGNFVTGGPGLPQITGRMEQGGGDLRLRIAMAEYRGGGGRLSVPERLVVQSQNGGVGFAGRVLLSGPLPGGAAEGLALPIDGNWAPGRQLAMWRGCVPVRFDRLAYANLVLDHRSLTLCPGGGGAMLQGTRFAAGIASLNLSGRLGGTPVQITSGPVGFAVPGTLAAKRLDVRLGPAKSAARFQISDLTARIGTDVAGRFAHTDVRLAGVPLDVYDASGNWRYANGRLTIAEAAFRLEDREPDDRFKPLIARGASLTLADGKIAGSALLREPASDSELARADFAHNLASGQGHADLVVAGLHFDRTLQPVMLTRLTEGVLNNVRGSIAGTGRIDWTAQRVTSSGTFATRALDFDALFGPVKGVSGEVRFTDLLGLVTAPNQRLRIASANPGIEVLGGELSFQLKPDAVLEVNGGEWPFMDGTLRLRPARMVIGSADERRFALEVEGLDAALFVQRLELSNISASGRFDGTLPLVFDQNGGRVEGGVLVARPPGGNVAYVGELTYEDLSPMGNFAFQALRSLNYRGMRIELDGSLSGDMVTRVAFDGLSQGATANQNFITRRIARLPIRFRVSIRAPFFSLFSSFKGLYDPSQVADPRSLGLLDGQGDVQAPVSETKP